MLFIAGECRVEGKGLLDPSFNDVLRSLLVFGSFFCEVLVSLGEGEGEGVVEAGEGLKDEPPSLLLLPFAFLPPRSPCKYKHN